MSKLLIALLAAAGLGVAGTALAADTNATGMSKDAYKAEIDKINADYKADKAKCDGLKDNAKDVCEEQAKGKRDVAKADAEDHYKNTPKTHYEAKVARADADYKVAKEKCDDLKGNDKDVCVKDAKAKHERAKADAKVERTAAEHPNDRSKVASARRDATEDKNDAAYKAAAERCDAMSGAAKDKCVADAKLRYHKS